VDWTRTLEWTTGITFELPIILTFYGVFINNTNRDQENIKLQNIMSKYTITAQLHTSHHKIVSMVVAPVR